MTKRFLWPVVLWCGAAQAQTPEGTPSAPAPQPATQGSDATHPATQGSDATPKTEAAPSSNGADEDVGASRLPRIAWEPYGFLRMQYIAVLNDPNVAFVGRDDGFELQNARVGVSGHAKAIAFAIAIDGAVDERAQINSPEGKLEVGLRDAWVDIDPTMRADDPRGRLVVRGGFFQSWADPEAQVPEVEREFVDRPIESRGMRATEGWQTPGLTPGRSIGAALRLDPSPGATKIGFELAVQNGADEYASNNDNDLPSVSAAVLARFAGGYVVGGARWNARTVGDLPFRQDETDLAGFAGAHVTAGTVSVGGGVVVQRTLYQSTGGPAQDAFGAHAQLMVSLGKAAVGYRFGILDPSTLILTDRVMEHTVGGVISVPSLRMRLQLQLTHVMEQESRDLSNDRAQLAAEVSL